MLVKFYDDQPHTIGQITLNVTSIDHIVLEKISRTQMRVSFVGTNPEVTPTPTLELNLTWEYPDRYFEEFTFRDVVLHIGMNSVNITTDANFIASYKDDVVPQNRFRLTLYRNSAEPSRVDKTNYLEWVKNMDGVLRDECPIVAPIILIEYPQVIDFNYIYIESFKRYYYVKNYTSVRTNLWQLELNVDVLMSFKSAILNLKAFVERNENTFDEDVIDKKRTIRQGYDVEQIKIPNTVFMLNDDSPVQGDTVVIGYMLGSTEK